MPDVRANKIYLRCAFQISTQIGISSFFFFFFPPSNEYNKHWYFCTKKENKQKIDGCGLHDIKQTQ